MIEVAKLTDTQKAEVAEVGDQLFGISLELDDVPLNDEVDLQDLATRISALGQQLGKVGT